MKIRGILVCMTLCFCLSVGDASGQQAIPAVASSTPPASLPPGSAARKAIEPASVAHLPQIAMVAQASFDTGLTAKAKGGPPSSLTKRVQLQSVDGVMTLTFSAIHYCRPESCDPANAVVPGTISITEKSVFFTPYGKDAETHGLVPGTTMKDQRTKKGDTYSLFNEKRECDRFGNEAYDSAFLTFMRLALTDFPAAVKQLQDSSVQ